ncbi:MAG: globin [Actinomycetota bacterium]
MGDGELAPVYEVVGGSSFFEELVDRFYDKVAADPELLAVYPDPGDLGPARRRLALFLSEYWGGPPAYTEERGHPRLRIRHATFEIGTKERDRWLEHMRAAVGEMQQPDEIARVLLDYFEMGAEAVRTRD